MCFTASQLQRKTLLCWVYKKVKSIDQTRVTLNRQHITVHYIYYIYKYYIISAIRNKQPLIFYLFSKISFIALINKIFSRYLDIQGFIEHRGNAKDKVMSPTELIEEHYPISVLVKTLYYHCITVRCTYSALEMLCGLKIKFLI